MNARELLENRRSVSKLTLPAPDDAVVERVAGMALRAPDHGALSPWKILVFRDRGRAKLGEILGEALRLQMPEATDDDVARAKKKVERAPLLIAVVATVRESRKVPEVEQVISAGIVMYGLHLGFTTEGFGSVWKTGAPCYDPFVKERLGLAETDQLVGFLYVGTAAEEPHEIERAQPKDFVVTWEG